MFSQAFEQKTPAPQGPMTEIEFAALLVSRVCHDLVGPLGAVVNGMEVLEDERDADMRADAIRLVTSSAEQALARIQFMRSAFGAAGSAGAELDLAEIGRLITGLLAGGQTSLIWETGAAYWPKDWAKLIPASASMPPAPISGSRTMCSACCAAKPLSAPSTPGACSLSSPTSSPARSMPGWCWSRARGSWN